jgi:hypothetical protein
MCQYFIIPGSGESHEESGVVELAGGGPLCNREHPILSGYELTPLRERILSSDQKTDPFVRVLRLLVSLLFGALLIGGMAAQDQHRRPVVDPQQLGELAFATSCDDAVQEKFNEAVAMHGDFTEIAEPGSNRPISASDE